MQLRLPYVADRPRPRPTTGRETLLLRGRPVVVAFVRHPRARHYLLHVQEDGSVRATIPRGGSRAEAARFVCEKAAWIERERYRAELRQAAARRDEGRITLRGEEFELIVDSDPFGQVARFAGFEVAIPPEARSPRPAVERFLRQMAAEVLPGRLLELAASLGRTVKSVSIRGQRTRWGSCAPSGRISLNWRLIQLPPHVSDYVLLHELTHLVHLDHSKRFWRELERVCPGHREARAWLRTRRAGIREAP